MAKKDKDDKFLNVDLERTKSTKIILPENMNLAEAERWIRRKREEEESFVNPDIAVPGYPLDCLVAFHKALRQIFGWSSIKPIKTFFGPQPPRMISIPISYDETVECPVGEIHLPGLDQGYVELSADIRQRKPCLIIGGEVKNKDVPKVKELAELTKKIVTENSIYKGKAIILGQRAEEVDRKNQRTVQQRLMETPAFMKPLGMKAEELILSRDIESQVKALLWAPIEQSEACRQAGVPLKRGILLEGPYGTGKSLTAAITADKAVENGWTFIRLEDPMLLSSAIDMACWYQPAIIFAEDIDSVVGTQDRNEQINGILNTLDGIDKTREVFVVLTTNHAESIGKAFMRPGRIDGVITFEAPDAEATERLLRMYGRNLIPEDADLTGAAEQIEGAPAAMIREVVERAKLMAISRAEAPLPTSNCIGGEDLRLAAVSLARHYSLALGDPSLPELSNDTLERVRLLAAQFGSGIAAGFAGDGHHKLLEAVPVGGARAADDADEDDDS